MLERAAIKTPCTESWNVMRGDDRSRFCVRCSKAVHDLGAMDVEEAEAFLERHLGSPADETKCVRLYRRPDGRVLTSECGPGSRRRHLERAAIVLTSGLVGITITAMVGISVITLRHDPDDERPPLSAAARSLQVLPSADQRKAQAESEQRRSESVLPPVYVRLVGQLPIR